MYIPHDFKSLTIRKGKVLFTTPHDLTSESSDGRFIVSQSSSHSTNNYAYKAMDGYSDGDHCAHTSSGGKYQWWKIHFLEGQVCIRSLLFDTNPNSAYITGFMGGKLILQGSNNDSTWHDIAELSLTVGVESYSFEFDNQRYFSYYRILNNKSPQNYLVIHELEFTYTLTSRTIGYIDAADQTFTFGMNTSLSHQINCISDYAVTFSLADGCILPTGIELSNTGILSGQPTSTSISEIQIILQAPYCKSIIISITIVCIEAYYEPPIIDLVMDGSDSLTTYGNTSFVLDTELNRTVFACTGNRATNKRANAYMNWDATLLDNSLKHSFCMWCKITDLSIPYSSGGMVLVCANTYSYWNEKVMAFAFRMACLF